MISAKAGNIYGFCAILMWSSSALIFSYCSNIPPFMLTALSSIVGFFVFFSLWTFSGKESVKSRFQFKWKALLFCAIFVGGYRLFYMTSMGTATLVDASLINYLWPVLLVFFSKFLPGDTVKPRHFLGVILGFLGLVLLIHHPEKPFMQSIEIGHFLALCAALTWAIYSVMTKRIKSYSPNIVPIAFLFSGVIFLCISLIVEQLPNVHWSEYGFMILLGFTSSIGVFMWDKAMKFGNIQILGVLSYFIPLLSTFLLILFMKADPSLNILYATILIFTAPIVASQEKIIALYRAFKMKKHHGSGKDDGLGKSSGL